MTKPAKFDRRFRQRLQLHQPTSAAIEMLARRDGVHVNYLEVALKWTFDHQWENDAASAYLDRYMVKNYQRGKVRYVQTTRYTGPREAPNNLVNYNNRPSKTTGEVDCLKLEWRITGVAALRRAGLTSLDDILRIDHREFWARRLKLFDIDTVALGRRYSNWISKSRRRGPCDMDGSLGASILHINRTVQVVLGTFRQRFDVRACLRPLSVTHLLPDPTPIYNYANIPPAIRPTLCTSTTTSLVTPTALRLRHELNDEASPRGEFSLTTEATNEAIQGCEGFELWNPRGSK